MKLNPNHPATRAAEGQWHKICALLMQRMGSDRVTIAPSEIDQLANREVNITIRFRDDVGIEIGLVDDATAQRLAREHGGLPE